MKNFIILISFFIASVSQATSVLLNGVTVDMADFNSKKMEDESDIAMCWALASSNAIAYWQWNQFGDNLPAGIPNGVGYTGNYDGDYTAVAEAFYSSWTNDAGDEKVGIIWWFTGVDISKEIGMPSVLKDTAITAGFYKDTMYVQGEYVKQFDLASNKDQNYIKEIIDYVIENNGACTLGIEDFEDDSGHAMTLWGYEIVDDQITGLYISDSDNDYDTNFLLEIEWNDESGHWDLLGEYEGYYVESITALVTVPEPSTYAIIFGIFALGVAVYRKRK